MKPETVMCSCYRAYGFAMGTPRTGVFSEEPDGEQVFWRRFLSSGADALSNMEGQKFPEIAAAIHKNVTGTAWSPDTPRQERLVWEATTRHLASLLCGDEAPAMGDLPAMEMKWRKWVDDRSIKLGVR